MFVMSSSAAMHPPAWQGAPKHPHPMDPSSASTSASTSAAGHPLPYPHISLTADPYQHQRSMTPPTAHQQQQTLTSRPISANLQPEPYQPHQQQRPTTPRPSSPSSAHSSPYVSPRLPTKSLPDPSSAAAAKITESRRGALSLASGPFGYNGPFPPLPEPMRQNGTPHPDDPAAPGGGMNKGAFTPTSLPGLAPGTLPGTSAAQQASTSANTLGPQPMYSSPAWSNNAPAPNGLGHRTSFSSASGAGPSFPLHSSYSLSSGANPVGGLVAGGMGGNGVGGGAASAIGAQRRGGLSLSPGQNSMLAPPGARPPFMGPHAAAMGRKQTSANPPPRNFACPNCPASFSRRHDLNRHARIHLAEKPYPCEKCAKRFSRKDALKRHMMVKCGTDAEGRPRKRRGRKSAAEKAAAAAAAAAAAGQAPPNGVPGLPPQQGQGQSDETLRYMHEQYMRSNQNHGGPENGGGAAFYGHDGYNPDGSGGMEPEYGSDDDDEEGGGGSGHSHGSQSGMDGFQNHGSGDYRYDFSGQ